MKKKFAFLNWYVPFVLVVLLFSFYVYNLGYIPDRLGFKKVTNGLDLRPADHYTDEYEGWFILEGAPGDVLNERLFIRSYRGEAEDFSLIVLDAGRAYLPEDEGFTFKADDAVQDGVGSFVLLPEKEVHLEPFEGKVMNFTLTIPADAEIGYYAGGILADAIEEEGELPVSAQFGARINTRIGVRIYLNVTDSPSPRPLLMTFENVQKEIKTVSTLHMVVIGINFLLLALVFFIGYHINNKK